MGYKKRQFNHNNNKKYNKNSYINNNNNENNKNSFSTNMVQIPNNNNNNFNNSNRGRGRSFVRQNKQRPYRSFKNKQDSNGNTNKSNSHRNNKHKTNKKGNNKKHKSIIIEKEQLTALVAGDHVQITTKHNQIIDGIVYCSIPQVPPLCIIHHYNPQRTKNVHVIALHEISRCIKFDEPRQEREVELRPINDENANEILEKNMAERKEKMDTLNIRVDDVIQDLFDFLYKTLPNKCKWNENQIEFPEMKMSIVAPYKTLNVNRKEHGHHNKSVEYVETQLLTFWTKHSNETTTKATKKQKNKKQKKKSIKKHALNMVSNMMPSNNALLGNTNSAPFGLQNINLMNGQLQNAVDSNVAVQQLLLMNGLNNYPFNAAQQQQQAVINNDGNNNSAVPPRRLNMRNNNQLRERGRGGQRGRSMRGRGRGQQRQRGRGRGQRGRGQRGRGQRGNGRGN